MKQCPLLAVPLALGIACASQPKPERSRIAPRVRVGRLFPQPESLKASRIAVTLEVQNPRPSSIVVSAIDYAIDTGDVSGVLTGRVEGGATLEEQQAAEIEFTVSIPFPEEPRRFLRVLAQGTLPLTVSGSVSFEDGSRIEFARNGAVTTPTFPRLVVHDAQAARYGQEGVDVTFYLRVVNDNPFAVTISDVAYTVAIEGTEAKSEQGAIGVRLAQGAAQEFEVGITLDEARFENMQAILRSGIVHYAVDGRVSVGAYEQPYTYEGQIRFAER